MKLHKPIVFLSLVIVAIVVFWLYPGINKANNVTYSRVYEDTDAKPANNFAIDTQSDTTKIKRAANAPAKVNAPSKKKMKRERIQPKKGLTKINTKMYSRAVHFLEEPSKEQDSLNVEVALRDSTSSSFQ